MLPCRADRELVEAALLRSGAKILCHASDDLCPACNNKLELQEGASHLHPCYRKFAVIVLVF